MSDWHHAQPLIAFDTMSQPLVDDLVAIIRKMWTNEEFTDQERDFFQRIVTRR